MGANYTNVIATELKADSTNFDSNNAILHRSHVDTTFTFDDDNPISFDTATFNQLSASNANVATPLKVASNTSIELATSSSPHRSEIQCHRTLVSPTSDSCPPSPTLAMIHEITSHATPQSKDRI